MSGYFQILKDKVEDRNKNNKLMLLRIDDVSY